MGFRVIQGVSGAFNGRYKGFQGISEVFQDFKLVWMAIFQNSQNRTLTSIKFDNG